jgi:hypothetical protein
MLNLKRIIVRLMRDHDIKMKAEHRTLKLPKFSLNFQMKSKERDLKSCLSMTRFLQE